MKCYLLQGSLGLAALVAICAVLSLAIYVVFKIVNFIADHVKVHDVFNNAGPKTKAVFSTIGKTLFVLYIGGVVGFVAWMLGGEVMLKYFHLCVGN